MNDEPHAEELLRAVERFLERDVVPSLSGVARFHARVAANVVAMVAREIETEAEHAAGEWARLADLLGDAGPLPEGRGERRLALRRRNALLVERIEAGHADAGPFRARLLAHVQQTVADKMAVSRPPRQRARGASA
jgi:hypothetical protein